MDLPHAVGPAARRRPRAALGDDRMTAVDLTEAHRRIGPLLGQHAWDIRRGIGSFVTMEFGQPLPPDQSGRVYACRSMAAHFLYATTTVGR